MLPERKPKREHEKIVIDEKRRKKQDACPAGTEKRSVIREEKYDETPAII